MDDVNAAELVKVLIQISASQGAMASALRDILIELQKLNSPLRPQQR